ncbi:hypothetical protein GGR51DRAFT_561475 [Nemania sp. FL0031]|nr:hypothetical protein GGR51DRAFT_561475 [Nemania sp. FL0031]
MSFREWQTGYPCVMCDGGGGLEPNGWTGDSSNWPTDVIPGRSLELAVCVLCFAFGIWYLVFCAGSGHCGTPKVVGRVLHHERSRPIHQSRRKGSRMKTREATTTGDDERAIRMRMEKKERRD